MCGCGCFGGWAWSARSSPGSFLALRWPRSRRPSYAVAQSASSIVVEGNRRVEAETIRSYFRAGPGERLDSYKIDQALKALYATGLFQDVRINQAGGRLIVTVVENPVINRVAFEGNKKVKDDQLLNEVQSKPRGTLSRPTVQADVQRIVEIYRRNGRFDVRVEPKIIELPNNRVDLVFEINEGEKTGVKKIRFVGNNAYRDQRLKDEIKTTETLSDSRASCRSADIYDPDRIEADRDLLRRFYLKHGFADVRVVSAVGELRSRRRRASSSPSRSRKARSIGSARSTFSPMCPRSIRNRSTRRLQGQLRRRLQRRSGRKVGRESVDRGGQARLSVRGRASARRPQSRDARPSTSCSSSRKARASISSASISAATRAPATMSSGANSISPRAMPITAR